MQSASSRIWTRVAVSISYDDNYYTTGTSTGRIYVSNTTVWNFNWMQTNDLCWSELLEIELFVLLTVCKQITNV